MSNWPELDEIQGRLSSKIGTYFPEVTGGTPTFQLTRVNRRTYSTICFFHLAVDTMSEAEPPGVAVKCYRKQGGGADLANSQYSSLLSIWPVFGNGGPLSVPRPLDFFPDLPALVMERVEGEPLQKMIRKYYFSIKRRPALARACRSSGEWLRRFHHATREASGRLDVEAKQDQAMVNVLTLESQGFTAGLCRQMETFLVWRAKDVIGTDMEMALIHGDFTVDNVLLDGNKIIVLDLHGKDCNAIYHDLATFLNSLELMRLCWPLWGSFIDLCAKSFLAGYFGKTSYSANALLYLRLTGFVSVALEILERRWSQPLARFWIRRRLEYLLHKLLSEHGALTKAGRSR